MNNQNSYKIEHKILTLAQCAVIESRENPASFEADGVRFSHWSFNYRDGWLNDAWIATATVSAKNFVDAINILAKKLHSIVPRVALISQSYIEYLFEPFVVHKSGSSTAFFRYTNDVSGGGLMFMENEQKALNGLLKNSEISEAFYYYWNDAVNATGYSAKLLLMFSALEALAKKRNKNKFKNPINLYIDILGDKLSNEIFAERNGLRNRLVHGEYFGDNDKGTNYLETVHNKVISYFNSKILSESLISENIVNPQRHFFGNKQQGNFFIKRKDGLPVFDLKEVLSDFSEDFRNPKMYEHVFDKNLHNSY